MTVMLLTLIASDFFVNIKSLITFRWSIECLVLIDYANLIVFTKFFLFIQISRDECRVLLVPLTCFYVIISYYLTRHSHQLEEDDLNTKEDNCKFEVNIVYVFLLWTVIPLHRICCLYHTFSLLVIYRVFKSIHYHLHLEP